MKAARVAVATLLLLLAFAAPAAAATKAELRAEVAGLRDQVRCLEVRFGHFAGLQAIYWRASYNYEAAISDVLVRDEPVVCWLRRRRAELGSNRAVARSVGLSPTMIGAYLRGENRAGPMAVVGRDVSRTLPRI